MRYFKELVHRARVHGVMGTRDGSVWSMMHLADHHWKALEQCQPIVFANKNQEPAELEDLGDDFAPQFGSALIDDLDAPFPSFSVEMLDGPITGPRPEDKTKLALWCIFAQEVRPKEFLFLALTQVVGNPETPERFVFASNAEGPIVKELLKRLHREQVGVENVRERLEIGTGKAKRVARLRKIIHVCPKKIVEGYRGAGPGRAVEWSHRWLVRGHWVRLPGRLGKDRNGDYCVKDFTWRSEHEKGPEGAPLVAKVRLVEEGKKEGIS